jgi:glucose-1-phosphate thymidylyltransferase
MIEAIEEQFRKNIKLKGEFFLADALNLMIESGAKFRVKEIETWLDAGTPEALFDTNRYLLENGYANSEKYCDNGGIAVISPSFIHPTAEIINSVIGPNVSIGANCKIENAVISDAIIDEETHLTDLVLKDSLIGRYVNIVGKAASMNVGDNTSWVIK